MQTCSQCHAGHLHQRHVTYINWHTGQFVVVPNVAAWQCDVCASIEIDAEAINRLMPLLGPVTQPDPTQPRRAHSPATADRPRDESTPDSERKRM
jgi:YgiT-type zinc finger domain-containing protein